MAECMRYLNSPCSPTITLSFRSCAPERVDPLRTKTCLLGTTEPMSHFPKITPLTTLNTRSSLTRTVDGNRTPISSSTSTKHRLTVKGISPSLTRSLSFTGRRGRLFPRDPSKRTCRTSSRMGSSRTST